jgi:hypothetical protein
MLMAVLLERDVFGCRGWASSAYARPPAALPTTWPRRSGQRTGPECRLDPFPHRNKVNPQRASVSRSS